MGTLIFFILIGILLISGCDKEEDVSTFRGEEKKVFRQKVPPINTHDEVITKKVLDKEQKEVKKQPDIPSVLEKKDVMTERIAKQDRKNDFEEKIRQEIREIRFESLSDGGEKVTFLMKGVNKRDLFALEGPPPRIVCDFFAAKIADNVSKHIDFNGKIINNIRIGVHEDPEPRIRVVLDLVIRQRHDYEVQPISYNDVNIYAIIVK